ncbi:MAG: PAS domain S-box protein [Deltaproteobacteria bacterium]|nr:PAS domain S-box protein [Deltaproteobacteria bacterium]
MGSLSTDTLKSTHPASGGRAIQVLLVDDELDLLAVAKEFLELDAELHVRTESSAGQALESIARDLPHVVVSDFQMPHMDGIELLKQVRSKYRDLPFILFTGRGREAIVIDALNHGADFYLQKGGDPEAQFAELGSKIRQAAGRRRAERALAESEARFRGMFDQAFQLAGVLDLQGCLVRINATALAMIGLNEAEVLGRPFWETPWWTHDTAAQHRVRDAISRAAAGQTVRFETTHLDRTGASHTIDFSLKPLVDDQGSVIALLPEGRDISHIKAAEAELREAKETFRAVIDHSYDAVLVHDSDGRVLDVNATMLRMYGVTYQEALTYSIADYSGPASSMGQAKDIWARVLGGEDQLFAWQARRPKDGALFDVEVYLTRVSAGDRPLILANVRDITERRKADEALRASESKYRQLHESMIDAFGSCDLHGRIQVLNEAFLRMVGYSRDELARMTYRDLTPKRWHAMEQQIIEQQVLVRGYSAPYEKEYRREDGTIFPVELRTYLLRDSSGRPEGMAAVVRDITERKSMERAIQEAHRKLRLLESITLHDIANKVSILREGGRLASAANSDPDVADLLRRMQAATAAIVRQIDLARAYQELGDHAAGWFGVEEMVAKTRTPEVALDASCRGAEVFADPMIERVFLNLFDNATRHGGHVNRIGVRCEAVPEGLRLIVEDDGVGVSIGEKERIFEKGYGKHTGFGLFLAREILAITGISIRETGLPGRGARFELRVPSGAHRQASGHVQQTPFGRAGALDGQGPDGS